jgi:predicted  nucleic acid-binding Zn-ribbon protein
MEAITAPTNGHPTPIGEDGKGGRLGTLEKRVEELTRQLRDTTASLRAAHDHIEELEEKLTVEGFTKLLRNAMRAEMDKALATDPVARESLINQMFPERS